MTQTPQDNELLDPETSSEGQENIKTHSEQHTIPPIAQKVSRFGPQAGSRFGKGATNFNPPNKQRPGRAAGRGR